MNRPASPVRRPDSLDELVEEDAAALAPQYSWRVVVDKTISVALAALFGAMAGAVVFALVAGA